MSSNLKKSPKLERTPSSATHEVIDPIWIVKALFAVLIVAAVCAYIVICGLFWRNQWQLVLSPSHNVAATPASVGLPFEDVRFGPDSSGQPELTGWWIPAAQQTDPTVLVMHGGSGSMSDVIPQARLLHDTRLNVLLFDYRGFGRSSGNHPTEQRMESDALSALNYVTYTRRVPAANIIAFGQGLGASIATRLCADHHDLSALILENADGDFETRAVLDSRSRLVPVSLLFNQKFPLADPLHTLTTPKLLISFTKSATPPVDFSRAADPKVTVEIDSPQDTSAVSAALRRFLDSYVTHPPPLLVPEHS